MRKKSKVGKYFYDVSELVQQGPYQRDMIYQFIKTGQLRASKPRGKWVVAAHDWERFLCGRVIMKG